MRKAFTLIELLVVIANIALLVLPASAVIRVSQQAPGPAHDGQTWQSAFVSITDAVGASVSKDEVWVMEGTYVEPIIMIQHDLSLYGGFAGTETERSQRDPALHPTVIQTGTNVNVALYMRGPIGADSVIDGFRFLIYRDAIYCDYGTSPTITHNVFEGGVYAIVGYDGSTIVASNRFSNVGRLGEGDFVIAFVGGFPMVFDNIIEKSDGGGIYYHSGSPHEGPVIMRNVLTHLRSHPIDLYRCAATVSDNLIVANNVMGNASAIYADSSDLVLTNNTIVGNTGAAYKVCVKVPSVTGAATIANNIIAFNSSGITTFVSSLDKDSFAMFNNCVFANNGLDYTNVKDATGFQGNISVDPQFVNRNGNWRLASTSPLIDVGYDTFIFGEETDVDGAPRLQGAHVDIGAYEFGGNAFTMGDVAGALRFWGGLSAATPELTARLAVLPVNGVTLDDAVRLIRKATGLEPNP